VADAVAQTLDAASEAMGFAGLPLKMENKMNKTLKDILRPQRLTQILDIGANPIDGDPPYKPMLALGLCQVTGFEPQKKALEELLQKKGPLERYLPYAIGDGEAHTLNICRWSGMTSLYQPDPASFSVFELFKQNAEVLSQEKIQTQRLDDLKEIEHIDFLKIDIQGGELSVFKSGRQKLKAAVAIQTEVSFMTLYKNQPTLGDIDLEMRHQGFVPHCFAAVKKCPIAPLVVNGDPRQPTNQLLEADIVYVRDFTHPEGMSDEQLKQLIMIAHHCYGSVDLAMRMILQLEQKNALPKGSSRGYLEILKTPKS
jgi:FkbM family methyltransferase